jgi:hypothetical protein
MNQQEGKITLGSRACGYHRQRKHGHRSQGSFERANTKLRKVCSPRPRKVDRSETSRRATRKIEQHDNRDDGVQITHQKQELLAFRINFDIVLSIIKNKKKPMARQSLREVSQFVD